MDPERFLEIANLIQRMPMRPFFEIAHAMYMCMDIKNDLGNGAHIFSRKQPICLYISCMISCFGSTMLVSFLLGEPIFACLSNETSVLIATGSFYFIFYMPFDLGYKIAKFLPVKILLSVMKETMRCRKIADGVSHAAKVFPSSYFVPVICGTLKGNGSAFLVPFIRLLRGLFTPNVSELLHMSFPTKASLCASIIFVLDKKTDILSAPHSLVYFGIVVFFIYFKISSLLLGIHDIFLPFENLFGAIFFGGIWDTIERLLTPAKSDQSTVKPDTTKNGKTDSAKKKE